MTFSTSIKAALAALVLGVSFAGVAEAGDRVFTATLAQPLSQPSRPIAGEAVWRCEGAACTVTSARSLGVSVCRQLGRRTRSVIIAFGAGDDQLSAEDLARCNAGREAETAQ